MDWKIIKKIARDAFRIDRVRYDRCEVLTVAHDNDRSFMYHGKYYSPLMDTIEDDLARSGLRCQSVARIISTVKGDIAYANVVSPEGAFARALILKRLASLFRRKGDYAYSTLEERTWADIFDRTGARKVLAIMPSRELCVAAHKRGIWVADVQHGVIADSHPWYGVTFRGQDPREWLPDAFLCWDQGSADVIEWARPKGVETIVYGNRWVARFLKRAPDDALVQDIVGQNREELAALQGKPTILVSLSWGNYNIPNGFMVDALSEIIGETSARFNWLLRLHPNQLVGFATDDGRRFTSYYERELRAHAPWEWPTRAPLPLVLSCCDLHISWNSSVAIEAAQMGIRSALMDPHLRSPEIKGDYYRYYRAENMIELIGEDKKSIETWIDANLGAREESESFERYDNAYNSLLKFLADAA